MKELFRTSVNGNKDQIAAALYYLGKHEISVKNVADVVEALIGIYLQARLSLCFLKEVRKVALHIISRSYFHFITFPLLFNARIDASYSQYHT